MERIERLTRLNVEIEGLLRVLSNRDNSNVRELLNEKFNDFSALFSELMSEMPEHVDMDVITDKSETASTEENKAQDAEPTEVSDEAAMDAENVDTCDECNAPETTDERPVDEGNEDDSLIIDSPTKAPLSESAPDEVDKESPACLDNQNTVANIDESIPGDEIVPVELGDFPVVDKPVEEPVKEAVAEQPLSDPEPCENKPADHEPPTLGERLSEEIPTEIRVDEMIARRTAGDLTKAFTLNDKIRFRRSLFASDADEFAHTLSDLSDIATYKQAVDYLVGSLGWQMNNPEVEEFLSIIRPHYPKAD